ncbi:MAG: kelch repeat-containing protein [Bacteroidota bacterium]
MKKKFTKWLMIFVAMFFAQDYVFAQDPGFANQQTAAMAGNFSATWTVTPSSDTMDCASGLGKAEAAAEGWKAMGPYVHFNKAGEIEARNGTGFEAVNVLPYEGGKAYTIEITGDVVAQTYDVSVTPEDSTSATVIATGYAFRTNNPQDTLNYLIMVTGQLEAWGGIPGSTLACSFMDDPFVEDPYPSAGNSSYALNAANNSVIDAQTGVFTATFDATPVMDSADCAVGLTQDASGVGAYTNYGPYVIFEKGGLIGVGKGGTTGWPTQDKPAFEIGTTYTVTLDIDVAAHTYTATVSGGALTDRVLIAGHEFRDVAATELNNLATQVAIGGAWGGQPGDIVISNLTAVIPENHNDWNEISVVGDVKPAGRGYGEIAPLGDGKALLFGGNTARYDTHVDDLTWVYDTETDTWTDMAPSGAIPARGRHGMAYAGDDQAIVFGGQSDTSASGYFGDTWIYDLSDNAWTKKADAPATLFERMETAMAYIGDDKVLLFGGNDASGDMNDTWVYDVSDDTWTELFAIGAAGQPAAMIACMAYAGDDKVVLYGKQAETWVFDLSDNTWTEMTTANTPGVDGQGMAYLGDGNVLLYGGYDAAFARESKTWIYNVADNTWTEETPEETPPTGNMIVTLCETTMYGGSNLVSFGGRGTGGDAMDVTFEFGGADWALNNPPPLVPGDWTMLEPATSPPATCYNELANLGDGKVLAFGGKADSKWGPIAAPATWVYDAATQEWTDMAPASQPPPAQAFGLAHIGDDKAIMFGGSDLASNWNTTWVYDLSDNTWTDMQATNTPPYLVYNGMAYLGDDKVLLYAGKNWDIADGGGPVDSAYVYDLSDNTWTHVVADSADRPGAMIYPNMSYFGPGKAIVTSANIDNQTWIFEVETMSWTLVDTVGSGVIYGELAYMGRGQVMAFGMGATGTWIFDGATNSWSQKDTTTIIPTVAKFYGLAETQMSGGGDVVLFGGYYGDQSASAETWTHPQGKEDLVPGDWSLYVPATSPPATCYNELANLGDGKVLAFGGKADSKWGPIAAPATWVADVATGTWTDMAPAVSPPPAQAFGLAHIGDDKAIMFGGSDLASNWNTTWVYDLSDNTWTDMQPTNSPPYLVYNGMAYLGDDKVLLYAGKNWDIADGGGPVDSAYVYDLSDNTWTHIVADSADRPGGMIYPNMSYFGNGKALVTSANIDNQMWVFDAATMAWTKLDVINESGIKYGELAYMGQQKVMAFGMGATGTWIFDGATNSWSQKDTTTIIPTTAKFYGLAESHINGGGLIVLFGGYYADQSASAETWLHDQFDADIIESVKPNMSSHEFGLYPNPVHDMLFVSSDEEVLQLEVYSVLGQQMIVESTEGQFSPTLDVSSLPEGVYVMYVSTANSKGSKMFVKQ